MKASDTFMDYQGRVGHARCKYNDGAEVRVARFRRQGKLIHDQRADWHQWLAQHALDISVAELPVSVLETEMSWWYLLDRGYSQAGYLGTEIWFDLDSMNAIQKSAFVRLVEYWLIERGTHLSVETACHIRKWVGR